jgi:serine-type D-Ala-D-Ala carboxypeptidase (penicillin-binding protein 5/6)
VHRKVVFITCLTIWIALGTAASFWAAGAYAQSRPLGSGIVLGASTGEVSDAPTPKLGKYPVRELGADDPNIYAKEYALYNPESGQFLVKSPGTDPVAIASTTKVMTAYLAVKYGKLDDIVTVTPEAATIGGSLMNLRSGEKMTVRNLIYGAMMVSGNDAADSLAIYIGGILLKNQGASNADKIARHVQAMNDTAARLHMEDTHYMDPVGLNDNGHSTATDLAKLMAIFIQQDFLRQVIGTADLTVTSTDGAFAHALHNSDRITTDGGLDGATNIGGKTGFTDAAGHCLVTSAVKDGITLIAVILNTSNWTKNASADEAKKLLNYGFANYTWR